MFSPDSIALVGASGDPEKLAGRPHRFLERHEYDGDCYLVNPNRDEIDGHTCYDAVADLPAVPDMAMVLVPARVTPSVVRACGEHGIPFATVIASGFSEAGDDDLEADLAAAADESGVRLLGPNSEGFLNLHDDVFASFSSICKRDDLDPGPVGFVTQSGAFGGALFQLTQDRDVGTSTWVSTGNEVDVDALDVLSHLVADDRTDTVAAYVESLSDGRRLLELGRWAAATDTDLVAMRVGASRRGQQAAASHTGSVASSDDVYDAVFEQAGVTRVRGVDEFLDAVTAFTRLPGDSRPDPGGGLGVVSMSGGAAVLCADVAEDVGLPLADLSEETVAAVDEVIPDYGSATNPLDVTAAAISDPAVFERCIGRVAGDPAVNALLVQFGNSGRDVVETFEDELARLRREHRMPVVCVFTGSTPRAETAAALRDAGILVFEDPVRAVETCQRLQARSEAVDRLSDAPAFGPGHGDRVFPRDDLAAAIDRLDEYGVESVETQVVADADADDRAAAAVTAAANIGYPVVVKQDPLRVAHKTESGGVHTDVGSPKEVRDAVAACGDDPVVVQRQFEGVEALVGVVDDDDFGPVLTLGAGGVFVELFDDFAYRALPVDEATAREMIAETPLSRLLEGFRGHSGSVDELARFVAGVSECYRDHDLAELECNPVVVTDDAAVAVDLLVE
nr:acetate--CoA ligase family protein [Halorubellus sp. JP-L1]